MSVYLRNAVWYARYCIKGARHHYPLLDAGSRAEATKMEAEDRREVSAGLTPSRLCVPQGVPQGPQKGDMKLSEATARMYEEKWVDNATGEGQKRQMEAIIGILGDMELKDINHSTLHRLKISLAKRGTGRSTINRYLSALRTILRHACGYWEVIEKVPPISLYSEKGSGRTRVVSEEELQIIVDAFRVMQGGLGDSYADLTLVLWDTGARQSEPIDMTWDLVDFSANRMTFIKTKNGEPRHMVMSARVREIMLRRKLEGHTQPFAGLNSMTVSHAMKRVTRQHDLGEDLTLHCLRHSMASRMTAQGLHPKVIQTWMGWKDIKMYERYSHLAPTAFDEVEQFLNGSGSGTQESGAELSKQLPLKGSFG